MKIIKTRTLVIDALDIPEEAKDYLEDEIKPMEGLFIIKQVQHVRDPNEDSGAWIMIFEQQNDAEPTKEQIAALEKHMLHDDDSQPAGAFRFYFGTLWYMRPYGI